MKRPVVRRILRVAGAIPAALLLLLCLCRLTEWRPRPSEIVAAGDRAGRLADTIRILSWNTGYAGLGDDMDFFMDGGARTRTSPRRAAENLEAIAEFLAACDADILLLQEVDRDSRRSYHTDQFAEYQAVLPDYHGSFALNYSAPFVPVPLRAPLGRVESGVAVFSRIEPSQVIRYQYDSRFAFPVRLFNLKRCWLAAEFRTARGTPVWVSVTHNTAYDTGNMRTVEMEQLHRWLGERGPSITGGDWNQNPTGYTPSAAEVSDRHFSPLPIPEDPRFRAVFDASTPTVRYLYEPLTGATTRSVIDFFLISSRVECLGVETIDLNFKNSDHNPVVATLRVES
jgi:endonuclease/exonuclease/phosphatase family metal-dependent hydrolase